MYLLIVVSVLVFVKTVFAAYHDKSGQATGQLAAYHGWTKWC